MFSNACEILGMFETLMQSTLLKDVKIYVKITENLLEQKWAQLVYFSVGI